jgi:hypothetical protein
MTVGGANAQEEGQISIDEAAGQLPLPPARFLNIFSRPETRNACFRDQKVELDGRVFVNCRFENCVLDISSVNYDLIGCTIAPSTRITCDAPAADLLRFFDAGFPWANQHLPAFFVPHRDASGALTVWFAGRLY